MQRTIASSASTATVMLSPSLLISTSASGAETLTSAESGASRRLVTAARMSSLFAATSGGNSVVLEGFLGDEGARDIGDEERERHLDVHGIGVGDLDIDDHPVGDGDGGEDPGQTREQDAADG